VTVGSTETKVPVKAEPGIVTVDAYDSDSEEEEEEEQEDDRDIPGETVLCNLLQCHSILNSIRNTVFSQMTLK